MNDSNSAMLEDNYSEPFPLQEGCFLQAVGLLSLFSPFDLDNFYYLLGPEGPGWLVRM